MERTDIDYFYSISARRIALTKSGFHRYLYKKINWGNRLICIKGSRGVGKSTLILQHIKESFTNYDKALYVSLDNIKANENSVLDLVEYHHTHGGTHIFFDEVHKFKHWQTLIKSLYDDYPDLNIVYTGSSMLQIDAKEGDLSRRQRVYELKGMSFREFIEFESGIQLECVELKDILERHSNIASVVVSQIRPLPLFEKYTIMGYYPFYKEEGDGYEQRLQEVVRQVLESDLPAVEPISFDTILKLKQMLTILSECVPITPNMKELYTALETNREQGLKMLNLLERAGLLSLLSDKAKAFKKMTKPSKFYLDNTNLMRAISSNYDTGTARETFFYNQLIESHSITLPSKGDFLIDGKYLFEVGGKGKKFDQIKDIPDSFIAADNIETGFGNKIPLWMFGLLY